MNVVNKSEIINQMVSRLENDNIEIINISIENDSELLAGNGKTINTLTGYSRIEICLFNKKKHSEFINKLVIING